jgi:uncharacterized membrane protein YphA (DoxX/SURF4 family)
MKALQALFTQIDARLTTMMSRYGVIALRISVGVVFFWFGILKFFPALSPAEDLASRTIEALTFGIIKPNIALPILATWEVLIGLGLITGKFMRITLLLLFMQMLGTITPLFLFPSETFTHFPYAPTLEGQYIIKNLVLVSAAFVIGATVRGGNLIADPRAHQVARQIEDEYMRQLRQQVDNPPLGDMS